MKKTINKYLPLAYGKYFNGLALISRQHAAKKAFELFCSPRKGKVLPHQKPYLDSAKDQVVTVNGLDIQTYRWAGPKETVLLLHGWESNAHRWRNLVQKLQDDGFNTIAVDAPAHGHSTGSILNVPLYSDCVRKIIEVYGPAHIIGHSMGGMTTIYNQYKYPDPNIKKLVSLGSPSELRALMDHYRNLLRFNKRVLTGLEHHLYTNYGIRTDEFSAALFSRELGQSGLIIHDELDAIAPFSASESIHAQWANSSLLKTSGLGHSLHQEEVNDKIIDFLNS
ncbi:MAG: alpha/beta hydrolase [Sediminicola sp.]|tara:strand:- start:154781 stop:155620 length:840 start_codon:yes stop_codon:yes gene_type:complete